MQNLTEQLVALPQYVTGYKLLKSKTGSIVQIEISTFVKTESVCEGTENLTFSTKSVDNLMLSAELPAMRGLATLRDNRDKLVNKLSVAFKDFLAEHGLSENDFSKKPNRNGVFRLEKKAFPVAIYHRLTESPVLNAKTGKPYPNFFKTRFRKKKYEAPNPWSDYSDADLRELASFNNVKLGRTKNRDKVIALLESAGVTPE